MAYAVENGNIVSNVWDLTIIDWDEDNGVSDYAGSSGHRLTVSNVLSDDRLPFLQFDLDSGRSCTQFLCRKQLSATGAQGVTEPESERLGMHMDYEHFEAMCSGEELEEEPSHCC